VLQDAAITTGSSGGCVFALKLLCRTSSSEHIAASNHVDNSVEDINNVLGAAVTV
jgi:hypothetical protein